MQCVRTFVCRRCVSVAIAVAVVTGGSGPEQVHGGAHTSGNATILSLSSRTPLHAALQQRCTMHHCCRVTSHMTASVGAETRPLQRMFEDGKRGPVCPPAFEKRVEQCVRASHVSAQLIPSDQQTRRESSLVCSAFATSRAQR